MGQVPSQETFERTLHDAIEEEQTSVNPLLRLHPGQEEAALPL